MSNYYLYRIGQFLTRALPLRVGYVLAVFLSDLHFRFSKADRRAVENNLKVILNTDHVPPADTRAVFRYFGKYLLDFLTMTKRLRPDFIRTNVDIKNIEHLNEVLQNGKGGIVASAHLGNWEMGGVLLPLLGYPSSTVALPHKDPRVNVFFNQQREAFGSMVIPTTMAVRRCLEHLKRNRLVAILVDRDFGQNGLRMDFLGKKAMIPKGAAALSFKTGAPIIPVFFVRLEDDRFEISFHPPLYPPTLAGGKMTDEALAAYIRQYLTIVEAQIRKNPTQWLIFREFWCP